MGGFEITKKGFFKIILPEYRYDTSGFWNFLETREGFEKFLKNDKTYFF